MGCDSHCYLEYYKKQVDPDEKRSVESLGHVRTGRDYLLFALMADVRNEGPGAVIPVSPPKGIPQHPELGWQAEHEYTLYVYKDADEDDERSVTPKQAKSWVEDGSSRWMNEEKTRISGPDWHSETWLTLPELKKVAERYVEERKASIEKETDPMYRQAFGRLYRDGVKPPRNLLAIIGAMEAIEADGKMEARLVVWFDN